MNDIENYMYKEYFNEFTKIPDSLSKEEITNLFIKKEIGDYNAENKIIEHNIRLVIYIVRTNFNNFNQNKKDLVSVGIIGLIKAVSTYNINKKISFSSYATVCIKNEIKMFLRSYSKHHDSTISFNEIIFHDTDDKEVTILDTLSTDINIEEDYIDKELQLLIKQLVENLNEIDKEIIMLYFGFYNDRQYSQKEIAEKFGLSQSYTSRKIKQILKTLKIELDAIQKNKPYIKKFTKITK